MEKKIFRVLVSWDTHADVLIAADDAESAKDKVLELLDSGASVEMDIDNGGGDYNAQDVESVETPDADDIEKAEANAQEYAESVDDSE